MARKKKIIQVPSGNVEKLMKVMRCSRSAVFNALAYRFISELFQMLICKERRTICTMNFSNVPMYHCTIKFFDFIP